MNGRSNLSDILLAIRERIVCKCGYAKDHVYLSMHMKPPETGSADRYCIILPVNGTVVIPDVTGGGRWLTTVDQRIDVYLRNRNDTDQAYHDTQWLTDCTRGILNQAHSVVNALQMFFPKQSDGSAMFVEPMRLVFVGEPRKRYQNFGWGDMLCEFECQYRMELDTNEE